MDGFESGKKTIVDIDKLLTEYHINYLFFKINVESLPEFIGNSNLYIFVKFLDLIKNIDSNINIFSIKQYIDTEYQKHNMV